ncbi:MAG: LamG-like jellyroll fold domain-containing protein [Ghiorsea sp.]
MALTLKTPQHIGSEIGSVIKADLQSDFASVQTQSNSAETQLNAEHNADGSHKVINADTIVLNGQSRSAWDATAGNPAIGSLDQVLAQGSVAANIIAGQQVQIQNAAGTQDLLVVDEQRGLMGMIGNIQSPLVHIPFKRKNDATALSGVQTFTNTTPLGARTYIDPLDGLVKLAAPNEPRFERMADGGIGLLLEGASANYALHSGDGVIYPAQSGTSTTATNNTTIVQPDGLAGGVVEVTGSVSKAFRLGAITGGVAGEIMTGSIWIKASAPSTALLDVNDNPNQVSHAVGTTWTRLAQTEYGAESANSAHRFFDVVLNDSAVTYHLWGAQLEPLPRATSYIPTTTQVVNRAADILHIPASGNVGSMRNVTFVATCDFLNINAMGSQGILDSGVGGANRFLVHTLNTGAFQNFAGQSQLSGSIQANVVTRIAVSNGMEKRSFQDGALVGSAGNVSSTVVSNNITIGAFYDGTSPMYGHIRNLRIYDQALTDVEVSAL